ncbi:MAG: hypothetical protein Q9169_004283 [Polycauliona sp. 2 TL-2023]
MASTANLAIIRNNYSLSTWLLLGASLQCLIFVILPPRVAMLPSVCMLAIIFVKNLLVTGGYLKNPYLTTAYKGKATVPLWEDEDGDGKVAVFLLGASSNHPLGVFAPGFDQIRNFSQSMWAEAEADTVKFGPINPQPNAYKPFQPQFIDKL